MGANKFGKYLIVFQSLFNVKMKIYYYSNNFSIENCALGSLNDTEIESLLSRSWKLCLPPRNTYANPSSNPADAWTKHRIFLILAID